MQCRTILPLYDETDPLLQELELCQYDATVEELREHNAGEQAPRGCAGPRLFALSMTCAVGLLMTFSAITTNYFLKDVLRASPAAAAQAQTLIKIPWSSKILFGFVIDNWRSRCGLAGYAAVALCVTTIGWYLTSNSDTTQEFVLFQLLAMSGEMVLRLCAQV